MIKNSIFVFLFNLSFYLLASYPVSGTIYKVTKNHQLTCSEQVEWGNLVYLKVVDENNKPLSGVKIDYWPNAPYRYAGKDPPPQGTLTTDESGMAVFDNRWPGCLPCDDNQDHIINFFFKVQGSSDTAVEISSGLYGDECPGSFCPGMYAINVWGHWSYQIEFKRMTSGSEEEIPTDHAGQSGIPEDKRSRCRFWHFYIPYQDLNPKRPWSISPTPTPKPTIPPTNIPPTTEYRPTLTPQPINTFKPTQPPPVAHPPSSISLPSKSNQPVKVDFNILIINPYKPYRDIKEGFFQIENNNITITSQSTSFSFYLTNKPTQYRLLIITNDGYQFQKFGSVNFNKVNSINLTIGNPLLITLKNISEFVIIQIERIGHILQLFDLPFRKTPISKM